MSQHLSALFADARTQRKALFVAYVTGGYPNQDQTADILLVMEAGGADVIEIGVPFSDPLADGATIQHANHVAVSMGVSMRQCFDFVRQARERGLRAPVLLMGYYNPILALGEERCVAEAKAAGADGFIVIDLPPEEAVSFLVACRANDMSFVPLVAPTTKDARIAKIAGVADAFLYCVSVTGTTGGGNVAIDDLPAFLGRVRAQSDLPLAVGFGITTRADVEAVGKIADAAVIGSAIIAAIDTAAGQSPAQRVREYVEDVSGR